jgi:pimeloyl-ACP methyl ester carboxylesterase
MLALPVLVPLVWILGLITLAVLGVGALLVVGLILGFVTGTVALVTGVGLLALTFLGRFLVLALKRGGDDEPSEHRVGVVRRIRRDDGTELQVETYGDADAPAIILTHGWGSDSTQWYYLKKRLADRFRVVVWDVPGSGKSAQAENRDYSLERMADDLEAVIRETGSPGAVVIGHSMGGMIVMRLCRRLAELGDAVAAVVFANSTHIDPVRTTAAGKLLVALERPIIVPLLHLTKWVFPLVWAMNWLGYLNGSMHLMIAFTGFAGTETRGQLDRVALLGARSHPGVLARQGLAMLHHNELETLFTLTAPTLILTANRDRVIVPEASEEMRRKVPSAELVALEPSGHVSVFERHDEFADAVASFADRLRRADPLEVASAPVS